MDELQEKYLKEDFISAESLTITDNMLDKLMNNERFVKNIQSIQINVNQIDIHELKKKLDELDKPTE